MAAAAERLSLVNSYAQGPGYRALVCIFLGGGNDSNNMVVPLADYPTYAAVRSASGLAIAEGSLLPITPASIGTDFGLHPGLAEIHPLFAARRLAVVCNVGPLVQPLTKQEYMNGAPRPYQLFSHSDQISQWQTSVSTSVGQTGWGGRIADNFGGSQNGIPIVTALAGGAYTRGQSSSPLTVAAAPTALNQVLLLNGFGTAADEVARANSMGYLRTIDYSSAMVAATSQTTQRALSLASAFNVDPILATAFPATTLGNQLKQVAKIIKLNQSSLGMSRQIFFCSLGGFDTHQVQVSTQNSLLTQLGNAMKAFYDATVEMGVDSAVTTFTLSDFSRTFQPSGTGVGTVGTDHAWGSHHLVMGGSVYGGDFFGVRGSNHTPFPTLTLGGIDDADTRGRWIPTTSVDQYGSTLARWLGVSSASMPAVFPNIGSFNTSDLGFVTTQAP
jgi:uncharacterized protein (DUF1501 family)